MPKHIRLTLLVAVAGAIMFAPHFALADGGYGAATGLWAGPLSDAPNYVAPPAAQVPKPPVHNANGFIATEHKPRLGLGPLPIDKSIVAGSGPSKTLPVLPSLNSGASPRIDQFDRPLFLDSHKLGTAGEAHHGDGFGDGLSHGHHAPVKVPWVYAEDGYPGVRRLIWEGHSWLYVCGFAVGSLIALKHIAHFFSHDH